MRTCASCGFENAEEDRGCPLCGATPSPTPVLESAETLVLLGGTQPGPKRRDHGRAAIVGQVYANRYRVDGLIGSGGMGQVFRVRDLQEERDLALKVLSPRTEDDPTREARFEREISMLSRIQHPAVPRVLDWGTREVELFFVTPLVLGRTLKSAIQSRGPWPAAQAAAVAASVADALAAAHALGIVHRDVKSGNVMIGDDGGVHLLDFGLARGVGFDTSLTRTGVIVGTPSYMSPEQFEDTDVDGRSDIYSLGVVLFEMLTGRLPFTAPTPVAVAIRQKTEPAPSLRSLRRSVPAWLDRVALRCLEKEPARRFPDAAGLAAELRKERSGDRPRRVRLPTGDTLIEDNAESSDWALVIGSAEDKADWFPGMALSFRERYYRLLEVTNETDGSWAYRFSFWPEGEVFRRTVEYEQDSAAREATRSQKLRRKLQNWVSRKKE